MFKCFQFFKQKDAMDCSPTCLMMIAAHHGQHYALRYLRERCFLSRDGVSALGIGKATIKITNILGIEQANFYVNDILKYNELEYDISNLTTGMYIISILSDNKVVSRTKINKL